jgi:hypothetical protein
MNDLSRPGLLEELVQQPEDQQQLFANKVRHVAVGHSHRTSLGHPQL